MKATTIPILIDPNAQEQIEKLDLQDEFEEMLDHAAGSIPDAQRFHVTFPPNYEYDADTIVTEIFGAWDSLQLREFQDEFYQWVFASYPPEIYGHFLWMTLPLPDHEPAQTS